AGVVWRCVTGLGLGGAAGVVLQSCVAGACPPCPPPAGWSWVGASCSRQSSTQSGCSARNSAPTSPLKTVAAASALQSVSASLSIRNVARWSWLQASSSVDTSTIATPQLLDHEAAYAMTYEHGIGDAAAVEFARQPRRPIGHGWLWRDRDTATP